MPHSAGQELWQDAAAFSARAHRGQIRKDGATPYASHPARVALTLRHIFGCEDDVAIAAAFLHDTIEDTATDYDDLEEAFGVEVADIVASLTKNMMLPEAQREPEYDARLAAGDWRARLIKLADVYDNLSDMRTRTAGDMPDIIARHLTRCDRALELARPDASAHPESARAIELVQQAMARVRG